MMWTLCCQFLYCCISTRDTDKLIYNGINGCKEAGGWMFISKETNKTLFNWATLPDFSIPEKLVWMGDRDYEEIMSNHFQKKQTKLLQLSEIQCPLTEMSTEFLGKRFESPESKLIQQIASQTLKYFPKKNPLPFQLNLHLR
jgi:hypothetical protein